MNRQSLISLTTAAIAVVMASGANAQEAPAKQNSIGPAIEFSGGGTSFGIKGKIGVTPEISVRPMALFGYTPNVSGANFSQAVSNGATSTFSNFVTLTDEQKRAQLRLIFDVALTDKQADNVAQQLSKALDITNPVDATPAQQFVAAKTLVSVVNYFDQDFKKLTPEQQQAQVKLFNPNLTTEQVVANAAALDAAVKTPATERTQSQLQTIGTAVNTVGENFKSSSKLTDAQKREQLQIFSKTPLSDVAINSIDITALDTALSTPEANRSKTQKDLISSITEGFNYAGNIGAIGFTPGAGNAYGAAVTYDFASADKKLSGYIGPRVLFANGTNKIGNFDTSTSETSIGLLLGADYAISADLTAGLSATYNFSKSGDLSVTGAGGFKGSAPVSGSSFDVGVNLGYRF